MNESTNLQPETNVENNSEAIPYENVYRPELTLAETVLQKLNILKVVLLAYNHNNRRVSSYFTTEGVTEPVFDELTKTFKLIDHRTGMECLIPESDIIQIGFPSSSEYVQAFLIKANNQKQEYTQLVEIYKDVADLTAIHSMSEEEAYSTMYGIPILELENTKTCKSVVMNYIHKAVDLEIEKLTEEFGLMNSSELNEFEGMSAHFEDENISDELASITEFLLLQKQEYSVFDGAADFKAILKCWPAILAPSFFSAFTEYADKYLG